MTSVLHCRMSWSSCHRTPSHHQTVLHHICWSLFFLLRLEWTCCLLAKRRIFHSSLCPVSSTSQHQNALTTSYAMNTVAKRFQNSSHLFLKMSLTEAFSYCCLWKMYSIKQRLLVKKLSFRPICPTYVLKYMVSCAVSCAKCLYVLIISTLEQDICMWSSYVLHCFQYSTVAFFCLALQPAKQIDISEIRNFLQCILKLAYTVFTWKCIIFKYADIWKTISLSMKN